MRDVLITSSVLIAALLILRRVFRNTISRRAQYALWGLVLLRLLIPVSLPAVGFNVLMAAAPVVEDIGAQSLYLSPTRETVISPGEAEVVKPIPSDSRGITVGPSSQNNTAVFTDRDHVTHAVEYRRQISLRDALHFVWYSGMILMSGWMLISNFRLWRKLCKVRTPYSVNDCPYPVYLVSSGLPSPCLFGLFRPAVYLTPAAVKSPETLRYVLAHETTHARHFDPLWAFLRCICLSVYWFHPLVWAAAIASKTDCELACDESVLRMLDGGERTAYGRTLLSLVPVQRTPAAPILTATTMTAGKKQLKDRITRIAENRQSRAIALIAVVALAALVCFMTFTGAKTQNRQRPLTSEELRFFHEEFFNTGTFNIHNQFLSSNYEDPKDIDLFNLFYCASGLPEEMESGERQAAVQATGFDPDCDLTKISTANMDAVLRENLGLSLSETNRVNLESFLYLEDYDAYYHFHGDTNYRMEIAFASGQWEGDLVKLYYEDDFMADGWKCLTLKSVGNGRYHFLSNQPCERPIIATAYPKGEPALTIPLSPSEPFQPEAVDIERYTGERTILHFEWASFKFLSDPPFDVLFWQDDNCIYAGIQLMHMSSLSQNYFLKIDYSGGDVLDYNAWQSAFSAGNEKDALGREVFWVKYPDALGVVHTAYYYREEDGSIFRLLDSTQPVSCVDLDGDGNGELISCGFEGAQLLYQHDNSLYTADVQQLLTDAWPEMTWWDSAYLDDSSRCLWVSGGVSMPDWGPDETAWFRRSLYFDGESLLVYADLPETKDHFAVGVAGTGSDDPNTATIIPQKVMDAAYQRALDAWQALRNESTQYYDDWRISALVLEQIRTDYPCGTLEIYRMDCQFHALQPQGFPLAGGMYIQEDGWVGGLRLPEEPYLVFQSAGNQLTEIENDLAWDYSPDSDAFRADLCRSLLKGEVIRLEDLSGEDLYYMFCLNGAAFLNELAAYPASEQNSAFRTLLLYGQRSAPDSSLLPSELSALEKHPDWLGAGGRAAYQRLLAVQSDVESQSATPREFALETLDQIFTEERVYLSLNVYGEEDGQKYPFDPSGEYGLELKGDAGRFLYSWWGTVEESQLYGQSLKLESADGRQSFQVWEDSNLVCCTQDGEAAWLFAEARDIAVDRLNGTLFQRLRRWYDETEWDALTENLVIPDRGQDHQAIAQAWAEQYEQAALMCHPESNHACSYIKTVAQLGRRNGYSEDSYPEQTNGRERFWFSYQCIFVPANERAQDYQNISVAVDYFGEYGAAPDGARMCEIEGVLYRSEKGWQCAYSASIS